MSWTLTRDPTPTEFDAMARAVFDALPLEFRRLCDGLVIQTPEFADQATLRRMNIENRYGLLGLYSGVDLTRKSIMYTPQQPDMVFLYRQPILRYAKNTGEDLPRVIAHVMIHEIGHHFGHSDDDMHEIERGD